MTLPDYIEEDTWAGFEESRRRIRIPLTDFARKRILNKLEMFHRNGYVANELLAEAAERGWRSVFMYPDCPRRESTPAEKHTQATVMHMVQGIGRG